MMPHKSPRRRLAALVASSLLALPFLASPTRAAQGAPSSGPSVSPFLLEGRSDLESAATYIVQRLKEHRFRLGRIDGAMAHYRERGDGPMIRQLEALKERETNAFHQTLAEYRRLLGDKDFDRLIGALRNRIVETQTVASSSGDTDRARPATRPAAEPSPSTVSLRRQEMERARASQRAQVASRLNQAKAEQLRLRAAQARQIEAQRPPVGALGRSAGRGSAASAGLGVPDRRPAASRSANARQRGRP